MSTCVRDRDYLSAKSKQRPMTHSLAYSPRGSKVIARSLANAKAQVEAAEKAAGLTYEMARWLMRSSELACAFTNSLTIRALISVKEGGPPLVSSPSSSLA